MQKNKRENHPFLHRPDTADVRADDFLHKTCRKRHTNIPYQRIFVSQYLKDWEEKRKRYGDAQGNSTFGGGRICAVRRAAAAFSRGRMDKDGIWNTDGRMSFLVRLWRMGTKEAAAGGGKLFCGA